MTHPLAGKKIVLRAPESGVFVGEFICQDEDGTQMKNTQRVWSWEGALDTAGLAAEGPKDARLSPVVPGTTVIPDGREKFEMSDQAISKFEDIGPWSA